MAAPARGFGCKYLAVGTFAKKGSRSVEFSPDNDYYAVRVELGFCAADPIVYQLPVSKNAQVINLAHVFGFHFLLGGDRLSKTCWPDL